MNRFTGAMFPNKNRTKDTQADYKGQIEIEGRRFWLSGWVNPIQGKPNEHYVRVIADEFSPEDYQRSEELNAAKQPTLLQAQPVAQVQPVQAPIQQYNNSNVDSGIPF